MVAHDLGVRVLGYAVCYMLNATLQQPAFKVALTIAKLAWLTFIVAIAIHAQANSPTEVTKMLLIAVMISVDLVRFGQQPPGRIRLETPRHLKQSASAK